MSMTRNDVNGIISDEMNTCLNCGEYKPCGCEPFFPGIKKVQNKKETEPMEKVGVKYRPIEIGSCQCQKTTKT